MFEILSALFFAHVLADYVFQTSKMVDTKDRFSSIAMHIITVYLCAVVALGSIAWPIAMLAGLHLAIDALKAIWVKTHKNDGIKPYLVDQLAHLVTIAVIAAFVPTLWADGIWTKDLANGGLLDISAWAPKVMLLLAGAIYATRAGGFAVGKLMMTYKTKETEQGFGAAPYTIGILERGLVFLFFMSDTPEAIGFIVAAKAIMRFQTSQGNSKKYYESIFIGTLASFSWAIAIAILTLAINNGLNGDPLLEIMGAKD